MHKQEQDGAKRHGEDHSGSLPVRNDTPCADDQREKKTDLETIPNDSGGTPTPQPFDVSPSAAGVNIVLQSVGSPAESSQSTDSRISSVGETLSVPAAPCEKALELVDDPVTNLHGQTAPHQSNIIAVPIEAKRQRPVAPRRPWVYLPVPDKEPKHDESYALPPTSSADGWPIVGARVRGKLHKQNGTNCDDWFEVSKAGDWTLIAVSDGGGSYPLSRVGAKIACRASVEHLRSRLESVSFDDLSSIDTLQETSSYQEARKALFEAMSQACNGITNAVENKKKAISDAITKSQTVSKEAADILNNLPEPTERDYYCTLLLCLHTRVSIEGKAHSLVMGCSVGDGIIASIPKVVKNGARSPSLLMKADSGEHSSETIFLTPQYAKEDVLDGKLYTKLFQSPQCIVVMTDGVADDYFPQDKKLASLFGDLVLNRIIPPPLCDQKQVQESLAKTSVLSEKALSDLDVWQSSQRLVGINEELSVLCASCQSFANALGVPVEEVIASDALLRAGALIAERALSDETDPSKRLLEWLDSYYAPTSFDDRALVVLVEGE